MLNVSKVLVFVQQQHFNTSLFKVITAFYLLNIFYVLVLLFIVLQFTVTNLTQQTFL